MALPSRGLIETARETFWGAFRSIFRGWTRGNLRSRALTVGGLGGMAGGLVVVVLSLASLGGGGDDPAVPVIRGGTDISIYERSTGATPTPSPTPAPPTPTPAPPLGDVPYRMIIEAIGVDAPVKEYGLDPEMVPEVPLGDDAKYVVAWYNFSSKPGTAGNVVFSGHVSWRGAAVFFYLNELVEGNEIKLVGEDGTVVVYTVRSVYSLPKDDPEARDVMLGTPDDVMTIITCDRSSVFTPDGTEIGGNYENRVVVRAALTRVTPGGGG